MLLSDEAGRAPVVRVPLIEVIWFLLRLALRACGG